MKNVSLNTGLFLIDSNTYTGEGINVYDYIHDDQVDWYANEVERMNEEAGHIGNSMVLFHIPLRYHELHPTIESLITFAPYWTNETIRNENEC